MPRRLTSETESEPRLCSERVSVIQERKSNRKCRAHLWSAVHFDGAVVIFDHFFCDVESESGATLALLGREVGIENLRHLLRSDSVTGVLHSYIDIKIFARAADIDRFLFVC